MKQDWKALGSFGTIGIELALYLFLPFYLGSWGDERLGTAPLLASFGFLTGLGASVKALIRVTSEANALAEKLDQQDREARRKFHLRADEDDDDDDP